MDVSYLRIGSSMGLRSNPLTLLTFWLLVPVACGQELDKEYLQRWTPGGDTNAADLPYRHRFAPYESENDENWKDGRWQRTKKGPFLTHSILLEGREIGPKVCAVPAGTGKFLLYDLAACSFVTGIIGGDVQIAPARFGLLNRPQLAGYEMFFAPASELWRSGDELASAAETTCDYQGLYLHGERVLFATKVAGSEVLESVLPRGDTAAITRELQVGPRSTGMWLLLAKIDRPGTLDRTGRLAEFKNTGGSSRVIVLDAASPGVDLQLQSERVLLYFPPSKYAASAAVTYSSGPRPDYSDDRATAEIPDLGRLRQPSAGRWGEPLVTRGALAEASGAAFVVDLIGVPHENPFDALFFLAGLGFFANGDAALATAHGDVWIVRGLDEKLDRVTWQRFATGLYQPLGLEIVDEQIYVLGRDQITRLHDSNDDGEADFYESFNHAIVDHGEPHAYAMRLERAADGGFLFLKSGDPPHGSALLHVSKDGDELAVVARGFRHPFGMGVGPQGEITVADNEGNWVPSSKIDLIRPGSFYGFLGSAKERGDSPLPARPLCYLPKVADNASGGQIWHTSPQWGPYQRNEMFHFSWGRCTLHGVLRQRVGEVWQAATVEVPGVKFRGGPAEAAFHPRDGQLYVVGLDGWQTAAEVDGSFERVRYTGKPVHLPSGFAAHADGIAITFSEPLDQASAEDAENYRVEQWNYQWSGTYGSYHYSVADPAKIGHDRVKVEQAILSSDGKQLFLKLRDLRPVDQLHVAYDLRSAGGVPLKGNLYATINALAPTQGSAVASRETGNN
jgi:hypothetical protein